MGDRFLLAHLDDPQRCCEEIVAFASRSSLDAIVAVDDIGAVGAARAANELGLRTHSPQAVEASKDKEATRRLFGNAGVPQPRFSLLTTQSDNDARKLANEIGYPLIVKPCCLSGSRGVIRVDQPAGLLGAIRRVQAIVTDATKGADTRVLIESYVEGDEVAIEAIVRSGHLELLAVFDKPDPLCGPYFEETIYVTPSRHSQVVQDLVYEAVASACRALGLREGPVHAEARIRQHVRSTQGLDATEDIVVLEVAARTIGGRCGKTLSFVGHKTLEELVLAHALGLSDNAPTPPLIGASGVMMLPIPRSGRLEAVKGRKKALGVNGITGLEVTIPPGRYVRALPEGDRYLGFLFANGATPKTVEDALRAGYAALDIQISEFDLARTKVTA
jgi:biotin carboxylase